MEIEQDSNRVKNRSILLLVALTSFMSTFLISSINIALPSIEKSLSLSAFQLSLTVTAYLLGTAMFMMPAGSWGDRTDNRKIFKIGVAIFTLTSFICMVAPNGEWLTAARFLEGVGIALATTTGQAILVSSFPPERRGQALGISVSAVYVGMATGPSIGGIITQQLGWRSIFAIAFIMGLIVVPISLIYLKSDNNRKQIKKKNDYVGTALFMTGLATMVYGSSTIPTVKGWIIMLLSLFLLFTFWIVESRIEEPLLNTGLFTRNRLFTYSALAALINYTSTFAISFFISLYLQKVLRLPPATAGAIIFAQPITMAIFSPIVGRLSDRIEPRILATIGMTMAVTGLTIFAFLSQTTPIRAIVLNLLFVGLGFALFSSPNMNTIMSSVKPHQYGLASGLAASMRVFGQIISISIITLLISFNFGDSSIEIISDQLFLKVMRTAFLLFAAIGIPGILFSFFRGKINRETNRGVDSGVTI